MIIKNCDKSVGINHNPNWPYFPDLPYMILISGGSGAGKTKVLLNLIKHKWTYIRKIYLYAKDSFEWKYKFVINEKEIAGIKELKNPKAFIGYLQKIDGAYENLQDFIPKKKRSMLIVFHDMISDMEANIYT